MIVVIKGKWYFYLLSKNFTQEITEENSTHVDLKQHLTN